MTAASKKYAYALFSAIDGDETLERVREDFGVIMTAVKNVDGFYDFMANPKITKEERKNMMASTFKSVDAPLLNMLSILIDKNRVHELSAVYDDFISYYNQHNDQHYVVVESVYELSSDELDQVGKYFIRKTGYKKLLMENKINDELIGGIRVFIGTRVYDGSVIGQLRSLQNQFKERANS